MSDYVVKPCYDVLPGVALPWESDTLDEDTIAERLQEDDDLEDCSEVEEDSDEDEQRELLLDNGTDEDPDELDPEVFDLDGDEDVHIPGVYENGKYTAWAKANLWYAKENTHKCTLCEKRFHEEDLDPGDHPSLCRNCNIEMQEHDSSCDCPDCEEMELEQL